MSNSSVLICDSLSKQFNDGDIQVNVIKEVSFTLNKAEMLGIVGASGSGKSTLLHCLGALDKPSSGAVIIDQTSIHTLNEKKQSDFRNKHLGFVYQFHHLLPEFTALENVAMPLIIRGIERKEALITATNMIDRVALKTRLSHKPSELSGGERQRIAIARALVTQPLCVLADEPTGNLDSQTAERVYELMKELNQELSTSFILVTHDTKLASKMDRVLVLENGKIQTNPD